MGNIGDQVLALRKRLGISQGRVAKKVHVTPSCIANVERNTRNASDIIIAMICKEFFVNENWLRTGEGEMFSDTSAADQRQKTTRKAFNVKVLWGDTRKALEQYLSKPIVDQVLAGLLCKYHGLLSDEQLLELVEVREGEIIQSHTHGLCYNSQSSFQCRLNRIATENSMIADTIDQLNEHRHANKLVTWRRHIIPNMRI